MKWICLIALCSSGPAWPQAASNDGDSAGVAFLNYIHVVNNLDKTLAASLLERALRLLVLGCPPEQALQAVNVAHR